MYRISNLETAPFISVARPTPMVVDTDKETADLFDEGAWAVFDEGTWAVFDEGKGAVIDERVAEAFVSLEVCNGDITIPDCRLSFWGVVTVGNGGGIRG